MEFLKNHPYYTHSSHLPPFTYYYFENGEEHGYIAFPHAATQKVFHTFYENQKVARTPLWFVECVRHCRSIHFRKHCLRNLL